MGTPEIVEKRACPFSSTLVPVGAPIGRSGAFSRVGASVFSAHCFSAWEGWRPSNTSAIGFSATCGRAGFLSAMNTPSSFDDRRARGEPQGGRRSQLGLYGDSMFRNVVCKVWTRQLPCFGVFPGYISRVVQVQEEPLASIEKAEPDEIVVNESQQRPNHDIGNAEPAVTFGHCNLGAHRGIAVHVIDITPQRRICVVQQGVRELASRPIHLDGGMRAVFLESPCPAANETQLGVRIETTMPDPTAKKKIFAWNPEATDRHATFQCNLHFAGKLWFKPLIRI